MANNNTRKYYVECIIEKAQQNVDEDMYDLIVKLAYMTDDEVEVFYYQYLKIE